MAANPQMPLLSSPHTCTARAEEAPPGGLEDKALCGGGSEEDTDVCNTATPTAAPKPWFEAPLSDGVGIPAWPSAPGPSESCCDS